MKMRITLPMIDINDYIDGASEEERYEILNTYYKYIVSGEDMRKDKLVLEIDTVKDIVKVVENPKKKKYAR